MTAIEAAIAFIEKHSLYGADIGRVRRTDRWNLPPVAVREAVIKLRNRVIGRVFHALGLIEQADRPESSRFW